MITTTLTTILETYNLQVKKTEAKVREIENNIRKLEDEIDFVSFFQVNHKYLFLLDYIP